MRVRLFFSFLLIVLVTVASVVFIARQSAAQEVNAFMFRGGMTGVSDLVDSLEGYYQTHGSWAGVESLFPGWARGNGQGGPGGMGRGQGMMGQAGMLANQRLRLADAQGNVLLDSGSGSVEAQLSPAEMADAIPLKSGGQTVGFLLTQGGFTFTNLDQTNLLNRLNRAALTAGLIGGGLALLLALILAYRLGRPIREMTIAARSLAHGDLSQRVPARGGDELAQLGRAFNHMADSLQKVEAQRRSLTADIAHELRTPLAVQQAHLEALQDGIYPLTTENLDPILEQNHLLARLVEDLRTLALAESGELRLERQMSDPISLVARVAERFRPQADARSIRLPVTSNAACPPVSLDPGRVEQILGNLLSNALRHTPEGGEVAISVSCETGSAVITVIDSGPGIPPESLPHVFERFYRADRSRSRDEGGTGLGLAIARQLSEAHGGTLTAANDPSGGAVFTLRLPL